MQPDKQKQKNKQAKANFASANLNSDDNSVSEYCSVSSNKEIALSAQICSIEAQTAQELFLQTFLTNRIQFLLLLQFRIPSLFLSLFQRQLLLLLSANRLTMMMFTSLRRNTTRISMLLTYLQIMRNIIPLLPLPLSSCGLKVL